jgi:hypothetical protein
MAARPGTHLRDPIYGLIPLSPGESEILGLPLLTRLKGIRQMGFAWAVFPGANHTRFEHSVGVMHAAGLLVRDLPGFSPREVELVRLAGLLHDVGHPPFSHTLELAARLYGRETQANELAALTSHEDATERKVLTDPGLKAVLRRHPEFRGIEPKELAQLAVGRHPDLSLSRLVHGEIDADRIDYIVRDNHHCGFPSGLDVHLIPALFLRRPDGEIVLNEDLAYFAEQLLLARHHLQVKIHDDPLDRLADLLMARTVRAFFRLPDRRRRRDFSRIAEEGGDEELLGLLRREVPRETRELEEHLAGRPPWRLLGEVGFSEISPPGRYAVSLLLTEQHRDLSVDLARRLGGWLKTETIVDVWGATPPSGALRTAPPDSPLPPVPITALPLIRGTVAATHRAMGVRVYVPAKGGAGPRLQLPSAQERYRALVDELFDPERAKRIFSRLAPHETTGFLVGLEIESALQETAREAHRGRTFAPDAILLLLHALFEAFSGPPLEEVRVYLEGVGGLAAGFRLARLPQTWEAELGDPFPYGLPEEGDGDELPSPGAEDLEADLDRLEAFGLLARLPREERHGRQFTSRDRYALTGWGRGLVTHGLLRDTRLARLHAGACEELTRMVRAHEPELRGFFGLAGRRDRDARQARRVRRSDLPLPVSR